MKRNQATILGDLSVAEFLQHYWQREPKFIPGALPSFRSPVSVDELAGLACEDDVESRLVVDTPARPYHLQAGPFDEAQLTRLPTSNWTLLVQDVDKHVPQVADLLELVSFLPRWAVDDVMISIAASGGSVGPHVDQYDVFLVQALGTRHWSLARSFDASDLRSDTDLAVLNRFEAEQRYVARPGDVLYVPPGVAHHGVASDLCMTYSFGFRTPSHAELLEIVAQGSEDAATRRLPIDVDATCSRSEIGPAFLDEIRRAVTSQLTGDGMARRLGEAMTSPKPSIVVPRPDSPMAQHELRRRLDAGEPLVRDPAARWLFLDVGSWSRACPDVLLFVHGESWELSGFDEPRLLAETMCDAPLLDGLTLRPWLATYSMNQLLGTLHERGYLKFSGDL